VIARFFLTVGVNIMVTVMALGMVMVVSMARVMVMIVTMIVIVAVIVDMVMMFVITCRVFAFIALISRAATARNSFFLLCGCSSNRSKLPPSHLLQLPQVGRCNRPCYTH